MISDDDMCTITQRAYQWAELRQSIDDAKSYIAMSVRTDHAQCVCQRLGDLSSRIGDLLQLGKR